MGFLRKKSRYSSFSRGRSTYNDNSRGVFAQPIIIGFFAIVGGVLALTVGRDLSSQMDELASLEPVPTPRAQLASLRPLVPGSAPGAATNVIFDGMRWGADLNHFESDSNPSMLSYKPSQGDEYQLSGIESVLNITNPAEYFEIGFTRAGNSQIVFRITQDKLLVLTAFPNGQRVVEKEVRLSGAEDLQSLSITRSPGQLILSFDEESIPFNLGSVDSSLPLSIATNLQAEQINALIISGERGSEPVRDVIV